MSRMQQIMERTQWFREARFGMFLHWGLYAIPARGEWVRGTEAIPQEVYDRYFNEFDPVDFDAKKWARMAKDAGMKYAILTAKHHDGFCMFDSRFTDYKVTNTPCGRDLVREFLDAFRQEGLRVGLYYSIIDWHHPDFPCKGERAHPAHPLRNVGRPEDHVEDFDRYLDYMHAQVKELVTDYGKLDVLWFDYSYGPMKGEAWRATELVRMVRSYQPHIIMDNRLEVSGEGFGSIASGEPAEFSGDFVSPEQIIPPSGICDANGVQIPWEACITMNNVWGYDQFDHNFKTPEMLIRKLVECVSKGGNMLLNVGPDARGNFPPESVEILKGMGEWMKKNGASVYGAGIAQDHPKPDWGRVTAKGNKLYLHIMEPSIGPVPYKGVDVSRIAAIRMLATGAELLPVHEWTTNNYPDYLFIPMGAQPMQTYALPDSIDTVVELTLTDA